MLDKLVANVLTSYFGDYFENIDTEQVKVSVWSGRVHLNNLKIRKDALRYFDVPVCVTSGSINALDVVIPWMNLMSESVLITMKGVSLVVEQKSAAGYDAQQDDAEALARKLRELDRYEEALVHDVMERSEQHSTTTALSTAERSENDNFSARLKATVLNNIKLVMEGINLEYRGVPDLREPTGPAKSVSLVIERIHTYACNDAYEPVFTAPNLKLFHQELKVTSVRIWLNEGSQDSVMSRAGYSSVGGSGRAHSSEKPIGAPLDVLIRLQHQPIPYDSSIPTYLLGVHLDSFQLALDEVQWATLLSIWTEVSRSIHDRPRGVSRPVEGRPKEQPRAWWRYAIESVRRDLQRHHNRTPFSWDIYQQMKRDRQRYMSLYMRARREQFGACKWLDALTSVEEDELKSTERRMPLEMLKLARRMAVSQVDRERGEYVKAVQQHAEERRRAADAEGEHDLATDRHPPEGSGGGGWFGWWGRFKKPAQQSNDLEGETPENQAAIQQMLALMRTTEWTPAQRLAIAKEFGMSESDARELSKDNAAADSGANEVSGQAHVEWKVIYYFRSSEVQLHEQRAGNACFASFCFEHLTSGLTADQQGRMDFWMSIKSFGVSSYSSVNEPSSIIQAAAGRAGEASQSSSSSSLLSPSLAAEDVVQHVLSSSSTSFDTLVHNLESNSIFFISCTRLPTQLLRSPTDMPYRVHVELFPLEAKVDVKFCEKLLNFGLLSFSRPKPDESDYVAGSRTSATRDQPGDGCGAFSFPEVQLNSLQERDIHDPKSRLMSLSHLLEKEWLVDWGVTIRGLSVLIVEEPRRLTCRMSFPFLGVHNDAQRIMRRRERLKVFNSQGTASNAPNAAAAEAHRDAATLDQEMAKPLGECSDDWLTYIHVHLKEVSVACLYDIESQSTSAPRVGDGWRDLVLPTSLRFEVTKNLLSRRQSLYPALSVRTHVEGALKVVWSRSRLSALCTSFSHVVDFIQSVVRRLMLYRNMDPRHKHGHPTLFHVNMAALDDAFVIEEGTLSSAEKPDDRENPERNAPERDVKCVVEVKPGRLILYHAERPSYVREYVELSTDGYQITRGGDHDRETLDLFVKRGGTPHEPARRGYRAAKAFLQEQCGFPDLFDNVTLLKAFAEKWMQTREEGDQQQGDSFSAQHAVSFAEVNEALRTVIRSSHTVPCHHLKLKCESEVYADALQTCIAEHATKENAYYLSDSIYNSYIHSIPQYLRGHQLLHFALEVSRVEMIMLEEEAVDVQPHCTVRCGDTYTATFENLEVECERRYQSIDVKGSLSRCVASTASSSEATAPAQSIVAQIGNDDSPHVSMEPCLRIHSTIHELPAPLASRKTTRIALPGAPLTVAVNTACVNLIEMLWDGLSILLNQVFSYNIVSCTRWQPEETFDPIKEEQAWRARCATQAEKHQLQLHISQAQISFYYPSTSVELRDVSCLDLTQPACVFSGSQWALRWNQREEKNAVNFSVEHPQLLWRRHEHCSGTTSGRGSPEEGSHKDSIIDVLRAIEPPSSGSTELSVGFEVLYVPPSLSMSDFLANDADGVRGYRFDRTLQVRGGHLNLLFRHGDLMSLLEFASNGIAGRLTTITARRPFLIGHPVIRWPRPEAPPPPFTWLSMRKEVVLQDARVRLLTEADGRPSKDTMTTGAPLEVSLSSLHVSDALVGADIEGQAARSPPSAPATCQSTPTLVKSVLRFQLNGVSVLPNALSNASGFVESLDLVLAMETPLFQTKMFTERHRTFIVSLGDALVLHGNTAQYAQLIDWMFLNFMAQPWLPVFHPVASVRDPLVEPSAEPPYTQSWLIDVPYGCFHMTKAATVYHDAGYGGTPACDRPCAPIDNALVLQGFHATLRWGAANNFCATAQADLVEAWNLGRLSAFRIEEGVTGGAETAELTNARFHRTPAEICDRESIFLRFGHEGSDQTSTSSATSRAGLAVTLDSHVLPNGVKSTSIDGAIGVLDVQLVTRYLFDLRDSFFSLQLRNSVGAILRWEPHIACTSSALSPASGDKAARPTSETQTTAAGTVRYRLHAQEIALQLPFIHQNKVATLATFAINGVDLNADKQRYNVVIQKIARNGIYTLDEREPRDAATAAGRFRPFFMPPQAPSATKAADPLEELFAPLPTEPPALPAPTPEPWFRLTCAETDGLKVCVESIWILLPHRCDLQALQGALFHGNLANLRHLLTYVEERVGNRDAANRDRDDKALSPGAMGTAVQVSLSNPCVVIADHGEPLGLRGELPRGVLLSLGSVSFVKRSTAESGGQEWFEEIDVPAASLSAIPNRDTVLVQPFRTVLRRGTTGTTQRSWKARVGAIDINVEQLFYEMLLRSLVRLARQTKASSAALTKPKQDAKADLAWVRLLGTRASTSGGDRLEAKSTTQSFSTSEDLPQSDAPGGMPLSAKGFAQLLVELLVQGIRLKVYNKETAVAFSVGLVRFTFCNSSMRSSSSAGQPNSCDKSCDILLSIPFAVLGVEGQSPLLDLRPLTVPLTPSDEHAASSPKPFDSAADTIAIDVTRRKLEETVRLDLGKVAVNLESATVVAAVSLLYAPYARIVLAQDGAKDERVLMRDTTLKEDLALSQRTTLRVANTYYNHITLNAAGHIISFQDCGEAILHLDEGVTLRIVNATLVLHGESVEHYADIQNGSYVIADPLENAFVSKEEEENATSESGILSFTGSGLDRSLSSWDSTFKSSQRLFRRILGRAALRIALPEPLRAAQASASAGSRQFYRQSLVLEALLSTCVGDVFHGAPSGVHESTATFDLCDFGVRSEFTTPAGDVVERTEIIARWGLKVLYTQKDQQHLSVQPASPSSPPLPNHESTPWSTRSEGSSTAATTSPRESKRRVEVVAETGTEVFIRYSDVFLCTTALREADVALGIIDSGVLKSFMGDSGEDELRNLTKLQKHANTTVSRRPPASVVANALTTTSYSVALKYLNVFVVDDSTDVDFPLFHICVEDLSTPVGTQQRLSTAWHVAFVLFGDFYDTGSTRWSPMLEKMRLDCVWKHEKNATVVDVQKRKGSTRVGLHCHNLKLHVSPMLLENIRRFLRLRDRFVKLQQLAWSSSTDWSPAKQESFYTHKVLQHAVSDLTISFVEDSGNRFPKPQELHLSEEFAFNFPRVGGGELPRSQQVVMVKFRDTVNVVNVASHGKARMMLADNLMGSEVVVEVSMSNGQKLVDLRSNVTLRNELPFPIALAGGVGAVKPKHVRTVPVECLRTRAVFIPFHPRFKCEDCSLGVSYDALPNLCGMQFLCVSQIVEDDHTYGSPHARTTENLVEVRGEDFEVRRSMQKSIYFLMQFSSVSYVGSSKLIDVTGTFLAPFSVSNLTGLPIHISLMSSKVVEGVRVALLDFVSDYTVYERLAEVNINTGETYGVTEADPFHDIFVDITLSQPNGASIGRCPRKPQLPPACIYSASNPGKRSSQLTLQDANGATLLLQFRYAKNEVIVWCPFWITNETNHFLQICDYDPRSGGSGLRSAEPQVAGLCNAGASLEPTMGEPFLFHSELASRNLQEAALYIRVGLHQAEGNVQWSGWSPAVRVFPVSESEVLLCPMQQRLVTTLSYSVSLGGGGAISDTRVLTFRPRWVVMNRLTKPIFIRHAVAARRRPGDDAPSFVANAIASRAFHVLDVVTCATAANTVQIRFHKDAEHDYENCQWSPPFGIDTLGDRDFNVRYEGLVQLRDHWPQDHAAALAALPPLAPEHVVEKSKELYVRRVETSVVHVSCYRRESTMCVVLTDSLLPPYVIENRTQFMIHLTQRGSSQVTLVYPRTTKHYAWEDAQAPPLLMLWAANGEQKISKPILMNFDPLRISGKSDELQQEIALEDGRQLYVRVRGMHGTSYAISITEDLFIDVYRKLPYPQCFYQVEVDSIYVLLRGEAYNDQMLLTIKPLLLAFTQGTIDGGQPGEDYQLIRCATRTVQLDDERAGMKEKVVLQLVDSVSSAVQVERHLLRTTPVICCPRVRLAITPVEVHLEDGFVYDMLNYWAQLKVTWGADVSSEPKKASSTFTPPQWLQETEVLSHPQGPAERRAVGGADWRLRIVLIDRLTIEKVMVSISLYRSPGAQNDPMWQAFGVLSLLIRSVQDARLEWQRLERANVCDSVWVLGAAYSAFYKQRLQEQIPNLVSVVGLDAMLNFVTDLLPGYFSDAAPASSPVERHKPRVGRRAQAGVVADRADGTSVDGVTVVPLHSKPAPTTPHPTSNKPRLVSVEGSQMPLTRVAANMPWEMFTRLASPREVSAYGSLAIRYAVRTTPLIPTFVLSKDCSSADAVVARARGMMEKLNARAGASQAVKAIGKLKPGVGESIRKVPDALGRVAAGVGVSKAGEALQQLTSAKPFARAESAFRSVFQPTQPPPAQSPTAPAQAEATRREDACTRCGEIELLRQNRFEANLPTPLPHPSEGTITWAEFTHHVSWDELTSLCTPEEVRRHANLVKAAVIGVPKNVIRLER